MQNFDHLSGSAASSISAWWRAFWKLNIPPKVRLFVWRSCNGWLPTAVVLAKQKDPVSEFCLACKSSPETVVHALWGCSALKPVRQFFPSLLGLRWRGVSRFLDFVMECHAGLDSFDFELLCLVWWRVWFCRNQVAHDASAPLIAGVVPWTRSFLSDFQAAVLPPSKPVVKPALKWVAPSPSWFKLNSDAAIDVSRKRIGIGVVIRDWKGRVAAAFATFLPVLLPVECAEALAILEGLKFAASMGVFPIGVESDTASVVGAIRSNKPPRSELGLIVDEILEFVIGFLVLSFCFCSRLCNSVAHGLAKFGVSSSSPCIWLEETPLCVEHLVSSIFSL
ncbi:hypothetical protein ACOSQ3_029578 [Xanthoceras sorbifolium]